MKPGESFSRLIFVRFTKRRNHDKIASGKAVDECTEGIPRPVRVLSAVPGDSETGLKMNWTCDGHPTALYLKHKLPDGTLLRTLDPDYVEGKIRDTGR